MFVISGKLTVSTFKQRENFIAQLRKWVTNQSMLVFIVHNFYIFNPLFYHSPRFFCAPLILLLLKLLLLVMELLFSDFSISVADGVLTKSICWCSRLFKLFVEPLWEPEEPLFVFSMLSIKLFTDKRESCLVMNGTWVTVPLVPFFKTLPLFFCFLRCAISCWTVVRIDCCDSFVDATTEKRFRELLRCHQEENWWDAQKISHRATITKNITMKHCLDDHTWNI